VTSVESRAPRTPGSTPALGSKWFLLTFVPFGFTTWAAFLYAGLKTKRPSLLAAAAGYGALLVAYLVIDAGDAHGAREAIGAVLALGAWVGGAAHALALRRGVDRQLSLAESPEVTAATREIERREYGRQLIRSNPTLARQVGVGRPDQSSGDSFGLVDVNHANAAAITQLPGITGEMARRVEDFCKEGGSFVSVEDLALFLDFPAQDVDALREQAVFVRDQ
jgi:DNA uptake protein ComE-like DNA-binding protein